MRRPRDRAVSDSLGRIFDGVADLYDEVRPEYPAEVYDGIQAVTGPLRDCRVLDLAAGAGLATRALAAQGAAVVAADPGANLLRRLRERSPGVPAVMSIAEALPFRDDVFDLVTCATAWHWLDTTGTLAECRRVVRCGGHLALWWANNLFGAGIDWEDAQSAVYERWDLARGSQPPPQIRGVVPREAAADLRARGIDVVVDTEINWTRTVSRDKHLRMLRTQSNTLALGDDGDVIIGEIAEALQPWPLVTQRLWGPLVIAQLT